MAFSKKTWLSRIGQGLNKFILNGGSTKVTLESAPDSISQQGDALSAANMNNLETRIDNEFTNVNSAINAIMDDSIYYSSATKAYSTIGGKNEVVGNLTLPAGHRYLVFCKQSSDMSSTDRMDDTYVPHLFGGFKFAGNSSMDSGSGSLTIVYIPYSSQERLFQYGMQYCYNANPNYYWAVYAISLS